MSTTGIPEGKGLGASSTEDLGPRQSPQASEYTAAPTRDSPTLIPREVPWVSLSSFYLFKNLPVVKTRTHKEECYLLVFYTG